MIYEIKINFEPTLLQRNNGSYPKRTPLKKKLPVLFSKNLYTDFLHIHPKIGVRFGDHFGIVD